MFTSAPLNLYLYLPSQVVRKVAVKTEMHVYALNSVLPETTYDLIYNSQVLDENRTFSHYKFRDEDVIIAVAKNSTDEITKCRWLQMTSYNEEIKKRIQCSMNAESADESARLRDLYFSRMEMKRKFYNQVIYKCMQEQCYTNVSNSPSNANSNADQDSITCISHYDHPCEDPLPFIFNNQDEDEFCDFDDHNHSEFKNEIDLLSLVDREENLARVNNIKKCRKYGIQTRRNKKNNDIMMESIATKDEQPDLESN